MTAVVGVLCRDGVVIGTDSSATFTQGSQRTIEQPTEKLRIVGDSMIVAGTGQVGLGQRFNRIANNAYNSNLLSGSDHIEFAKALSRMAIDDFSHTYLKPGLYGSLIGFHMGGRPRLCEFAVSDFQPEFKDEGIWYVSMGSGQPITDPFLALMRNIFWRDGLPTIQDATFAVTWALEHAIEVNPGGINSPIRVAVLEQRKEVGHSYIARIVEDSDLQEHKDHIRTMKALLRGYAAIQESRDDAPYIPRLETD